MSTLIPILWVVVYVGVLLGASARWGWRGSACAIGLAIGLNAFAGLLMWAQPHERFHGLSSSRDLACYATGYAAGLLLLGLVVSATLHRFRNSEFGIRAAAALFATVLAAVPAVFLHILWVIYVLRCDLI
jgi:hypothetical protein